MATNMEKTNSGKNGLAEMSILVTKITAAAEVARLPPPSFHTLLKFFSVVCHNQ